MMLHTLHNYPCHSMTRPMPLDYASWENALHRSPQSPQNANPRLLKKRDRGNEASAIRIVRSAGEHTTAQRAAICAAEDSTGSWDRHFSNFTRIDRVHKRYMIYAYTDASVLAREPLPASVCTLKSTAGHSLYLPAFKRSFSDFKMTSASSSIEHLDGFQLSSFVALSDLPREFHP